MPKPFFHELSEQDFTSMVEKGVTWGQVMENYQQPEWCHYPNALNGQMGCWSLTQMETMKLITFDWCKTCECHQDNQNSKKEYNEDL